MYIVAYKTILKIKRDSQNSESLFIFYLEKSLQFWRKINNQTLTSF